jgi:hypothetical protein
MTREKMVALLAKLTDDELHDMEGVIAHLLSRRERERRTGTPCESCGQPWPSPEQGKTLLAQFEYGKHCWDCCQPVDDQELHADWDRKWM